MAMLSLRQSAKNARLPYAGLALLLTLTGCENAGKFWTESEIREIAEEVSLDNSEVIDHNAREANALADRVDQLELENGDLRGEIERLEARIDDLEVRVLLIP